ncbi:hypothetical protein [Halobacterium noricense]|uniref:hypothetical protein n=1 Tax=Halobacterium noricense TaxID=223182 RepID=UPI001E3199C5|nr:hypothetical protein [Halobacterium noricense]UHH24307.1 hypothetical protein LT974_09935 [Halobacterium noricense]
MNFDHLSLDRVVRTAGYGLFGVVGAIVVALVFARGLSPLQPVIYDAFYLVLGPWSSTELASVLHITAVGVLAVTAPVLVAEYTAGDRLRTLAVGATVAFAVLVVVSVLAAFVDVLGFPTVAVAVALVAAAATAGLRRVGASRGATVTFAGSLPVLALLLVLLGVGLGWGGGYDVVAEPIDASAVDGPAADFADAPAVRDDLFSADACDPADDGTCRLSLRSYEHERQAARVLAANGVRCPFVNTPRNPVYDPDASFVAEHDDQYYRVTCEAYGD